MTTPNITPEMIAAWLKLRNFAFCTRDAAKPQPWETELVEAIDALDNSDFMVPIEEAGEWRPAQPHDCAALGHLRCSDHATPLDPAEWGDTTRDDMTRHQSEDSTRP